MRAKLDSTASSRPGQVSTLWGQASQVAAWGSHSAGQRKPLEAGPRKPLAAGPFSRSVGKERTKRAVGVDATVAQERPVAAGGLDEREITLDHQAL